MDQKDSEALTSDIQCLADSAGIKLISCKINYEPIDALVSDKIGTLRHDPGTNWHWLGG